MKYKSQLINIILTIHINNKINISNNLCVELDDISYKNETKLIKNVQKLVKKRFKCMHFNIILNRIIESSDSLKIIADTVPPRHGPQFFLHRAL